MLKLTLQPGEYLDIGKDIRVVFTGGSFTLAVITGKAR